MQPIRVAVVGVGVMGGQHAAAYDRSVAAELTAVVDERGEIAHRVAEQYRVPAFTSVEEMLDQCDIAAVSVCTNDERHVAPTLACLAAGKHVLLEKPIATTIADAETIIAAAAEAGTVFLVGHVLRFDPQYRLIRERVARGELGEVLAVFARRLNHVGSQEVLRGRVSVLSFLGVHDFDYLRWLTGSDPVRVHTESVAKVHRAAGYDIEDHTFTLVRFASGVVACVEAGWVLPDTHPRRADFKLEVIGTGGMAQYDLLAGELALCTKRGWEIPRMGAALDLEAAHFLDCILNDRPPLVTGKDGREALRLSLAAQESARTGRIVDL